MKEYKAVVYQEGMISSIIFGSAKVDPENLSRFLNDNARDGWRVITMEKDERRTLLFWKREAYVILLERDR